MALKLRGDTIIDEVGKTLLELTDEVANTTIKIEELSKSSGNGSLKYKGHCATIDDLPSTGQPSGEINSGFNLDNTFKDVVLNPVIPDREPTTRAILKDFDPSTGPTCSYYVAFLQKYDSYWTYVYAECLKTDYPEQLKFISGVSIKTNDWTYTSAIVVLYDANKPVYRRRKDDSWELITTQSSYLVCGNHLRLNTALRTPKDSDGSSGTMWMHGNGYTAVTLSTKNKGYTDNAGTRYYFDEDYIIITPGKEDDYGVIYTGGSNVVENDVYSVGDAKDLYRGNETTGQWEILSETKIKTINGESLVGTGNIVIGGTIVETGSANGGNYVKFDNGIMICTKKVSISNQAVVSAYFAGTYGTYCTLGAMPATFKSIWSMTATAVLSNTTDWLVGNIYGCSATSMGQARICRPNASGNISGNIHVFVIGTWE